ncbi:MAG: hypothetical protein SF162_00330 [bacterium]|nr:hypothetical protein [bacterium]
MTLLAALAAAVVVIAAGAVLLNPPRDLIVSAVFSPEMITPNADGIDDVTVFRYTVSRAASVSLTLTNPETGQVFPFRADEQRSAGDYAVAFSGVVDGYTLPGEQIGGEVLRRLIPDGDYTWVLSAVDAAGERMEQGGTLSVQQGDAPLPEIVEFTVFPTVFTPNQDGISDRTQVNVFLAKDAQLDVYLEPIGGGALIYIPERIEETERGQAGRHTYDFDGGVDLGANPPPDGDYRLVAFARDAVGQEVRQQADFRIEQGGKPLAQIVAQPNGATVVFEAAPFESRFTTTREQAGDLIDPPRAPEDFRLTAITLPVGDLLVFQLTIENYSDVPIRTSGPPPGTVYEWDQAESTLGWFEEAGAWRVGIDCTTASRDYPWRWAVGDDDSLTTVTDPDTGNTYRYLPPGARSVVWGAIRMTRLEARNPQNCWAGLIHEQVEIAERNRNVGAREIELIPMETAQAAGGE